MKTIWVVMGGWWVDDRDHVIGYFSTEELANRCVDKIWAKRLYDDVYVEEHELDKDI